MTTSSTRRHVACCREIAFTLADASLSIAATIANLGAEAMPASFGFHPAFRWPLPYGAPRAAHRIRFARPEPEPVRRIDGAGLLLPRPQATPVRGGTLVLADSLFDDDALIFDRIASRSLVYGAASGPQIEVGFDGMPQLGVWTKPGAGFICIEPWSGFADPQGFDGDIRTKPSISLIAPGAQKRHAMTITLRTDKP